MNSKSIPAQRSGERLQKVLAAAGVASRRECEQWILDGRVEVDRRVVTELGVKVDPDEQEIRVDGSPIKLKRRAYYLLNKPVGVVCTNSDPEGRTRIIDLIKSEDRLFSVGRLDRTSEGLILVTNDGELANKLAHPKYGIRKTYLATVQGKPTVEQLTQLREGVYFSDGKAKVVSVEIKKRLRDQTILEIVLDEGRNREIRRLLARVGHKVLRLKRIAIGCIHLDDTPAGGYRKLTSDEVAALTRLVARNPAKSRPRNRSAGTGGRRRTAQQGQATKSTRSKQQRRPKLSPPTPSVGTVIGGEAPVEATDSPKGGGARRKANKTTQAKRKRVTRKKRR